MKLKDFAKRIESLAKCYPDLEVVYSRDEEGNGFQSVVYEPSLGKFDGVDEFEQMVKNGPISEVNAICIN